jgi:Immunity protein 52
MAKPQFKIAAYWGPRADAPEALAFRFLKLLNQLRLIDPLFANWYLFTSETTVEPFDMNPVSLTKTIAQAISYDDYGNPELYNGYRYGAFNDNTFEPNSRGFQVGFRANNLLLGPYFLNRVVLETDYGIAPEDNAVTFRLFRAALLAIVEAWEPGWCIAFPVTIYDFWPRSADIHLHLAWMSYVPPRFAPLITPPPTAIAERTGQGGLLMSATAETFRVDNPAHLAAARDILKALAPFEALPWPPDATPE